MMQYQKIRGWIALAALVAAGLAPAAAADAAAPTTAAAGEAVFARVDGGIFCATAKSPLKD